MKNKLIDLNNHLFEQLERLQDEDLTTEDLTKEIARTDAMVKLSEQIIGNANLAVRAAELVAEHSGKGAFEYLLPLVDDRTQAMKGEK